MTATIAQIGQENQVNTTTANDQFLPSVTNLGDGGWVVTWTSMRQDASTGAGVYQQRYDANGLAVGGETLVNITTASWQYSPSTAALPDGGWVVTWTSGDGDLEGIFQQRYDKFGSPTYTSDKQVNTTTTDSQDKASVAALTDGGWVVTWHSVGQDNPADPYTSGIYQQRYDADGNPQGGEVSVNITTTDGQLNASTAALADGGWIVTWESSEQDGSGYGIYLQRYDRDGNQIHSSGDQLVNGTQDGQQLNSSVTALKDGGWVVTWEGNGSGDDYGIFQQRYDVNGNRVGSEVLVNTVTADDQKEPSVTALADGGWVVTWQMPGDEPGSFAGIYQQRYDSSGQRVYTGDMLVNLETANDQSTPTVTAFPDGSWVVTWTSTGQDGSGGGIYQRYYKSADALTTAAELASGSGTNGNIFQVKLGGVSAGDTIVGGSSSLDTLQMIEAGALDLSAPASLSGIEIVQGSSGDDVIVSNVARLSGMTAIQGGLGNDELLLEGGTYDLSSRNFLGTEKITLQDNGNLTFNNKSAAMLAHAASGKTVSVTLEGQAFTLSELSQLYQQGISTVTDSSGTYSSSNQAPVVASVTATGSGVLGTTGDETGKYLIDENDGAVAIVQVTAQDNDGGTISYALADTYSGLFAISANGTISVADASKLPVNADMDYSLTVEITDGQGGTTSQSITVRVKNVNHAPAIQEVLAAGNAETGAGNDAGALVIYEDEGAGVVADVNASDSNGDAIQYSLIGVNGDHNGLFSINASTGEISITDPANLNLSADQDYVLTVQAADGNGGTTAQNVTIRVKNVGPVPVVNGAPAPVTKSVADTDPIRAFSDITIVDDSPLVVVTIKLDDPSKGHFENLTIGAYNPQTGTYIAYGNAAAVTAALHALEFNPADRPAAETGSVDSTSFTITVNDGTSVITNTNVQVNAIVTNRDPTDIALGNVTVREAIADANWTVGELTASDQTGSTFTYKIQRKDGTWADVSTDGRFKIVAENGKVYLKANGYLLDYEQARSHAVKIQVSDQHGGVRVEDFTINVANLSVEKVLGSAGHDLFIGGTGHDRMYGYNGNDRLYGGSGNDYLYGLNQNDTLTGDHGNDYLNGGAHNDRLYGGTGNDKLYGGAGADSFVFNTRLHKSANVDYLGDFYAPHDTIQLENAIFRKLTKAGGLSSSFFEVGSKAADRDDYIVYNKTAGYLYYDYDGSGKGAAVLFAKLKKGAALTHKDFYVI